MIRNTVLATALAVAAAIPALANAQAAAAPASPHTLAGNMAIVSDYRFRGISQTFEQPAIQGGIDYSHSGGFYVGTWSSSISGLSYSNTGGIEVDIYGGFKKGFGDVTLDLGVLQYWYPNAKYASGEKYDTTEVYIGATWKWLSAKYSITTGDYFGVNSTTSTLGTGDSKGSGYLDITASYEVAPKLTLIGHYGMQTVKNYKPLEYNDYKIGVTYDMNGWLLGAAFIGTDADETIYTLTDGGGKTKEIGKSTVVLSVGKTF